MIRPLQPFDTVRYALFGGSGRSNRAYTLDSLGTMGPNLSATEAVRLTLSLPRKSLCSLVWSQGARIVGIAAARPRSGSQTWEVAKLLLASDDAPGSTDLLTAVCQGTARRGGQRVFIRLPSDDPVVDAARHSGFVHCATELLYRGRQRTHPDPLPIELHEKRPQDEYGLFQLYNAATPFETRMAAGVTFEQWKSSSEPSRGRCREFVYEKDRKPRAHVRTIQHNGASKLMILVHPGEESNLAALVDYGLARSAGGNTVHCLVSEHQVVFQRLLSQRGFDLDSEYVTMVKSMTAPLTQAKDRRAVTVAST